MVRVATGARPLSRRILLVVGRDNWQKSERMSRALLGGFGGQGLELQWEDPAGHWIYRLQLAERRFGNLPARVRKANLRIVQILYAILHWGYIPYLLKPVRGIEDRSRRLKRRIAGFGDGCEIVILSFSSGGRASSLVADALRVSRLICLGYPFRAPGAGDEPDRYAHLSGLRTSMLIFQGDHDEYGGLEVPRKYRLSPSIELQYVDSDHGYDLKDEDWSRVLGRIRSAIEPDQGPRTDCGSPIPALR